MTEEFCLSNRERYCYDYEIKNDESEVHPATQAQIFEAEDVKEFIKRLKKELLRYGYINRNEQGYDKIILDLVGDKLTK